MISQSLSARSHGIDNGSTPEKRARKSRKAPDGRSVPAWIGLYCEALHNLPVACLCLMQSYFRQPNLPGGIWQARTGFAVSI